MTQYSVLQVSAPNYREQACTAYLWLYTAASAMAEWIGVEFPSWALIAVALALVLLATWKVKCYNCIVWWVWVVHTS